MGCIVWFAFPVFLSGTGGAHCARRGSRRNLLSMGARTASLTSRTEGRTEGRPFRPGSNVSFPRSFVVAQLNVDCELQKRDDSPCLSSSSRVRSEIGIGHPMEPPHVAGAIWMKVAEQTAKSSSVF
jgi:hypothetical protein